MNNSDILITNGHRCPHRGLAKYPSIDKKLWDPSSKWILQWDNIMKHPGARARGCHCDVHKPPWLYPKLGILKKKNKFGLKFFNFLLYFAKQKEIFVYFVNY